MSIAVSIGVEIGQLSEVWERVGVLHVIGPFAPLYTHRYWLELADVHIVTCRCSWVSQHLSQIGDSKYDYT